MSDSKKSQAKHSGNAAELLVQFCDQQAQHDENHVEVSAVYEHLLEDIKRCPSTFAFAKDEILDGLNEAWPHIGKYYHWSLHMWQALVGWHKNPMSVPNALREDSDGYFLKEDIDIAAWLNKVIGEIPRQAIMIRVKAIFGNRINFETVFSGSDPNLLCGIKGKTQIDTAQILNGSDFLMLILNHCSLSREQIYNKVIPYMIRDDVKRSLSAAAVERAAHMALRNQQNALYKGKSLVTGTSQSKSSVHALTPAKTAPPSGEPESGETAPPSGGATSTLHDESTMDINQIVADIYHDC
ncbi:hypothetical protein M422DRAFT_270660 [Sphaerobolus stellatus SS14]|uniref:Uncharacterized protein n=1 Tax=Sphaerobolus stellatus (strain SS14) TaxID=990650 RepID=A0A0C9UGH1_SPHS4|nr:hypothetical protein M422DRAFT_270660 [Sphaerobolus stellatus SS14]